MLFQSQVFCSEKRSKSPSSLNRNGLSAEKGTETTQIILEKIFLSMGRGMPEQGSRARFENSWFTKLPKRPVMPSAALNHF